MTATAALVLVEPGAHRPGGHRNRTLTALATAHGNAVVVAPYGIADETRTALQAAGARLAGPTGMLPSVLAAAGMYTAALAAAGRHVFASRRWPRALRRLPHQVTLLARCLVEASCVRTGRRLTGGTASVVVLSASEALHGAAGLLGGPHLRFVHELVTTEDVPLRVLGRLARPGERRVAVLAPTRAVRDALAARFPRLPLQVRPFAVADPGDRLTDVERVRAREAFGIPAAAAAVCLVGGWWPYKDLDAVDAALTRLDVPLHVLVTGAPLDDDHLQAWEALPHVRLHTRPGPVPEAVVREAYAASDATLVARRPGVTKESGLVVDAVRLGVPLIVSDHDPALTQALAGQDWARLFPTGGGAALADVLRDLAWSPLPRPAADAAADLGVPTAAEQTAVLTELKGPYSCPPCPR
ncbi:glycosyltransferase family 4 protein [Streptomyces sp. S1D4-23]|uniref:glycosyltransferase family 4 protein n=1 Tax=Streptomyces sp. S1D4-23 TaxID=2594463 RepID=UPI001162F57C|nr:glycosyltransferase family 4 protein [Streptomyces sp. S1D4-23]QDO05014.1 glycosyltransferase family 4 protein [Streptomyces sp. S1D4-23]